MKMIAERIKTLREYAGLSQAQLAKRLNVTRSSVNAWEMGLSTPTMQYVVDMAKLFHVSSDYILCIESDLTLSLRDYSNEEISLIMSLLHYIDTRQ